MQLADCLILDDTQSLLLQLAARNSLIYIIPKFIEKSAVLPIVFQLSSSTKRYSRNKSAVIKRNFWLAKFLTSRHVRMYRWYSTYQIRWENWWLGLRVECLGKCVRLVFGLGFEKEKYNRSLRISPIFFSGYSFSRTVACCGYLRSNQKVSINAQHTSNK